MEMMTKKPPVVDIEKSDDYASEVPVPVIYIDPEKEKAALRKFDKFLLPVSIVFLVLSGLDRNNVSEASLCSAKSTITDS